MPFINKSLFESNESISPKSSLFNAQNNIQIIALQEEEKTATGQKNCNIFFSLPCCVEPY